MAKICLRGLPVFFLISFIVWYHNFDASNTQQGGHLRLEKGTRRTAWKEKDTWVFNVLDYGAKGDGTTHDAKAFERAWAAACDVDTSTMLVPSGFEFLLNPVSFSGNDCASNIIFQLDGMIVAPTNTSAFEKGSSKWINFLNVNNFTIKGNGTIDGQGEIWWNDDSRDYMTSESASGKRKGKKPKTKTIKPTALKFQGGTNISVTGITIQNSPHFHLKFDDCIDVQVYNMSTSSPADSPNTDGIHLQNSQNVVISYVNLSCGDDCISIQTGSSNIYIHHVNCGPGHGISIGGLGKDNSKACVSNVTVRDIVLQETMTGVRIKTWQGGSGWLQGVEFSNIQVYEVNIPIIIDQYYCDKKKCRNMTSAVAISGVSYNNIRGTYTKKPVHFGCSDSQPCKGISLSNIELKPANKHKKKDAYCWNAYGEVKTKTVPAIDCLQDDGNSSYIVQYTSYSC